MSETTEVAKLVAGLMAMQQQTTSEALRLTDEQLDAPVRMGDREQPLRSVLYQMVVHPREHYVHLGKVFQHTGSPAAHPSEAEAIMEQAKQSFGALLGLLLRTTDEDLDREYEGHTLRTVIEHLAAAHSYYGSRIKKVTQPS